ncbi:MAG: hypothetical protein AB1568_08675 [Thermodesulfobacteriota bacterium]
MTTVANGRSRFCGVLGAALGLVLLAAGCVPSAPVQQQAKSSAIFFPEPPDLPRYQFLRGYLGSSDFTGQQSAFDALVVGRQSSGLRVDKAYGVAAVRGGIYVADTNFSLVKFDLINRKFGQIAGAQGLGKLVQPINACVDEAGNIFVADPLRKQVLQYDSREFFVKAFRFSTDWKPVDVDFYKNMLFVGDGLNRQVHIFDRGTGDLLQSIGQEGAPDERMGLPLNIAISPDGILHISDAGKIRVMKYDLDGHFLGSFGSPGQSPGRFARPRGIAIDREGKIYVVDAAFDNIQVFAKDGQLLTFLGGAGDEPGQFNLAAGVEIDYANVDLFQEYIDPNFEAEYLVYVTSQFGNRPVSVFAYGKQKGVVYPEYEELLEKRKQELEELRKTR